MKQIFLIALFALTGLSLVAQTDQKKVFQKAVEARMAGDNQTLNALHDKYADRPELSQLIERETALLYDNFEMFEGAKIKFSKETKACFGIQEVQRMVLQSDYINGMKKLDEIHEDQRALTDFEKAYSMTLRGLLYSGLNDYHQASLSLEKAKRQFLECKSEVGTFWTSYVQFSVNWKYHRWKLAEQLEAHLDKSLLSKYPAIEANFSTGKAGMHFIHDRMDQVVPSLKKSLKLYESFNDSVNIMKCHFNMGLYETMIGDMDTALLYFQNAKANGKWFTQIRQETRAAISLYGILDKNPSYRSQLLQVFGFTQLEGFERYIENLLYQVKDQDLSLHYGYQKSARYENLGDDKKLIEALKLERDLLYELIVTDTSSVELVQYMLDLEKSKTKQLELDNARIKQEKKIQALQLNRKKVEQRILIISFITIILGAILFVFARRRMKKLRMDKNQMKSSLNQVEQELLELQQGISNKAKAIRELQEQLALSDEEQSEHLESLKTMKILTDQDWGKFRNTFVALYPNYQEVLSKYAIELTGGEERLVMMMRLNLSKHEISEMLGVGKESVRKSHYRLRKKLAPIELDPLLKEISIAPQKL